ncbi:methyl-accepting chemotaxis protein, partial [Xanthomonas sp. Sa3BUA13]|nr:methyl-accepting chemotaxis protein [Xanthomonas surreyensis]
NQTVTQMDESTQQNAALVEEASAAARSMEQQATELTQAVALFKLEENAAPVRQPTLAKAPKPRNYARPAPAAARRLQSVAAVATDKDWQEF